MLRTEQNDHHFADDILTVSYKCKYLYFKPNLNELTTPQHWFRKRYGITGEMVLREPMMTDFTDVHVLLGFKNHIHIYIYGTIILYQMTKNKPIIQLPQCHWTHSEKRGWVESLSIDGVTKLMKRTKNSAHDMR